VTTPKKDWPKLIRAGSTIVKIYRTIDRKYSRFTLSYYEGSQRRVRQFTELSEARAEGKIIAERLNAGQGAALQLHGRDRDAHLYAISKLKPLQVTLSAAVDEYVEAKKIGVPLLAAAKLYRDTHFVKLPSTTVTQAFGQMLEAKRKDGASKAYLIDLKTRLGRFSRDFQAPMSEVSTEGIDAWLRALQLSPRSRNNHRNAIVALFNFAKAGGYLNRDRSTAAEHTSLARRKVEAIEVFSPSEFARLLSEAEDTVLPFLVLGGFCGLRTIEITRLLWEDFRWQERSIVISSAIAKTRTRRLAPLTDPAVAWLSQWKNKTGRVLKIDKLHKRVGDICKAAGVPWKNNGLRHSFITYRVASSKDFVKTAFEAGNSPQVIRSNYDAVATEQEGKKWFSILPEAATNVFQIVGST
jgi:integrase